MKRQKCDRAEPSKNRMVGERNQLENSQKTEESVSSSREDGGFNQRVWEQCDVGLQSEANVSSGSSRLASE